VGDIVEGRGRNGGLGGRASVSDCLARLRFTDDVPKQNHLAAGSLAKNGPRFRPNNEGRSF
jgi:hypothetical protein